MSAEVVRFPGLTRLDTSAEAVLHAALEHGLEGLVIAGFAVDGTEYFASSYADGGDALWLIERLKLKLLQVPDTL